MVNIVLQSISVYPIKSTSGIQLSTSWVEGLGLAFDRRFMITTENGEMLTARTEPRLCLIQANLTQNGIHITAPGMPMLAVEYAKLSSKYQNTSVWGTKISGQQSSEHYNLWFSRYLNKPCQLLFFGENSERFVKNKNSQVGFADGYPLLLLSLQSLAYLNQKLTANNVASMAQFRPNIVVDVETAFEEDTWKHIRIGEVEFEITKPCSRCIFTTINPETAEKNIQQEPLNTLKTFRQVATGDVMFGQNLVPLNQGQIKLGDKVEIIETQQAPLFVVKKSRNTTSQVTTPINNQSNSQANTQATLPAKKPIKATKINKKPNINFSSWNKEVIGNNKKTILEQSEDAGLILPYSCRGGMCGRCIIKLDSGEVEQLSTDGLSVQDIENGYVLACSAIPKSNIVLSKP